MRDILKPLLVTNTLWLRLRATFSYVGWKTDILIPLFLIILYVTFGHTGVSGTSLKDKGPIPKGEYHIFPSEISEVEGFRYLIRNGGGLFDWGHGRVPLHPSEGTDTLGRDGFFIHGGKEDGSAGCQDIGHNDREFFHNLKKTKGKIKVIVE